MDKNKELLDLHIKAWQLQVGLNTSLQHQVDALTQRIDLLFKKVVNLESINGLEDE